MAAATNMACTPEVGLGCAARLWCQSSSLFQFLEIILDPGAEPFNGVLWHAGGP